MSPILERHGQWALGAFAGIGCLALVCLAWFARRPGHHDAAQAEAHVGEEYPSLRRSAQVLLLVSYVCNSAMSPILPYRFEALGTGVAMETPLAATWVLARVVAFAVLWRSGFWHGRWGALLFGALAMAGGFACVVAGPGLAAVLAGLAFLGVGLGVVYYTALYYAMSVGGAAVDAGGTFEALIGTGYTIGPLAGLAGAALGGGPWTVVVVCAILALAGVPAARPYLASRALRARASRGLPASAAPGAAPTRSPPAA
jgi:hypothetical protein